MGLEVLPAYFLPLSCIATLTRWACDFRVQRQVLGTVNRAMNCDSANLQKQMNASQRQLTISSLNVK